MMDKQSAILVGPFMGELKWEMYRFAPYIIHLKKENPACKVIVYTRVSRFDLYGKYADVLIPLNIKANIKDEQEGFRYNGITQEIYLHLIKIFKEKYKDKFELIGHIYPKINDFYYKLKWQFPRIKMNYDFRPRENNSKTIQKFLKTFTSDIVFYNYPKTDQINNLNKYSLISSDNLFGYFEDESVCTDISFIGCIIEIIKRSKFVVSDFNSEYALLALLLKKPLITLSNISKDEIHLMNPYNTPVICCSELIKGFENYENKF